MSALRLLFPVWLIKAGITKFGKDCNSTIDLTPEIMDSLHEPHTNLEKIRKQTQSDPGLMVDLLHIYLDQTPTLIAAMKGAVADADWPLLRAAAHKIKPSFRIVGESGSGEQFAKEIEQLANASSVSPDEIEPWLKKLEMLCRNIYQELNHELAVLEKMGFTRS